jgi:hypothetical protein
MHQPQRQPRPKLTTYYAPSPQYIQLLKAAADVLQAPRPNASFPVRPEVADAATAGILAVCDAVIADTARWGNPDPEGGSTWHCVAWQHRSYAERVKRIVAAPVVDGEALGDTLVEWRRY